MDAESDLRRAKIAQGELNLCAEFLQQENQRLYEAFASSMPADDLHEIHSQARALTSLEEFLNDLVNTGKLINENKENNQ
jgi:hypothetical protein